MNREKIKKAKNERAATEQICVCKQAMPKGKHVQQLSCQVCTHCFQMYKYRHQNAVYVVESFNSLRGEFLSNKEMESQRAKNMKTKTRQFRCE